jgi:hypothetical protein
VASEKLNESTIWPSPKTAGTVKSGACLPTSTLIDYLQKNNEKQKVINSSLTTERVE